MASPTGIEPVTYALGGHCAIQLCHGDVVSLYQVLLKSVKQLFSFKVRVSFSDY